MSVCVLSFRLHIPYLSEGFKVLSNWTKFYNEPNFVHQDQVVDQVFLICRVEIKKGTHL